MSRMISMRRVLALSASAAAFMLPMGCVGYRTAPEQSAWHGGHPNVPSVEESVTAALRWAVERVPPPDYRGSGGQFAVSPPEGMRRVRYLRIVANLGPEAFPVMPESMHLPTYHVGAVNVRGARATVDVYCPVVDRWGDIAYKPYTLTLQGGVTPWRVTDLRAWQIGAMQPPSKYALPETDGPVVTDAGSQGG